jgi:outer membrane protein assembly factor BamA
MNVGPGTDDRYASAETVYGPARTPGIDRQSHYLRGGVLAHVDLRDSPYGPRSGGQYYGRFDYYDDRTHGAYSFRRLTAEAQQFVPLFNKKRVLAGRVRSVLSWPNAGQRVPFYLQPSLGAADDLRGYQPFRFHDDNSLVMNGEWRWEVMSSVDGALFIDAGKVYPRPGLTNFANLRKSYGGGLRFRAPLSGAVVMRLDVGVSREGVQFWFVFNDLFAAPQIRTGRELSPPPGRLP